MKERYNIFQIIDAYRKKLEYYDTQKCKKWDTADLSDSTVQEYWECKQIIAYLHELLQLREDAILTDIFHPKPRPMYTFLEDKTDIIRYRGKFGDYKPSELGVDAVYICPKCEGKGKLYSRGNDGRDATVKTCDICKGAGYTEKLWKPKMVQQGWEEIDE